MKTKYILQWLLVILLVSLLGAPVYAARMGEVTRLTGIADVTRGKEAARLIKLGEVIFEQDILRTKSNSTLEITTNDKGRLTLGANSRMEIAKYVTQGKPQGLLQMTRGRLRAFITKTFSKHSESFKVRTPTAVAGVMGTDFGVVTRAVVTNVFVFKGVVVVANVDPKVPKRVILKENQKTSVKVGEPPSAPVGIQMKIEAFISGQYSGAGLKMDESVLSGEVQGTEPEPITPQVKPPVPTDEPAPPPKEPGINPRPTIPVEPTDPPPDDPTPPPEEGPPPRGDPQAPAPAPPTQPGGPPGQPDEPPGPPESPPGQTKKGDEVEGKGPHGKRPENEPPGRNK